MINEVFRSTLAQAVAGSHEALEEILKLYEPLIRKHSYLNGKQDDDLRQYCGSAVAVSEH